MGYKRPGKRERAKAKAEALFRKQGLDAIRAAKQAIIDANLTAPKVRDYGRIRSPLARDTLKASTHRGVSHGWKTGSARPGTSKPRWS